MLVYGSPAPYASRASPRKGPASRPETPALRRWRPAKSAAYPERSTDDQNHDSPYPSQTTPGSPEVITRTSIPELRIVSPAPDSSPSKRFQKPSSPRLTLPPRR